MNNDELHKKYLRLALIAAVVIVAGIVAVIIVQNVRLATMGRLTTVVVPDDAVMTIDGKKAAINKKIGVATGERTVTVKRTGFKEQTQKFTSKRGESNELRFFLEPVSAEAFKWLKDHPEQAHLAESLASQDFDKQAEATAKRTPLINDLPFIDQFYRIDYGMSEKHPDDPTAIAIYIRYWSEQGKADALEWIKFKGYDPDKLEIIYIVPSDDF